MSWWSIIKNQIASTKGKTFQLDFSEPMVEDEETCKEKFLAIVKKFWELDFKQFLLKDIGFGQGGYASNTYKVDDGNSYETSVSVTFARSSPEIPGLNQMPEEVACWFLENLKQTARKSFTIDGVVSVAEVRIEEIKKDRRFVYSLFYDSMRQVGGPLAFHTSIRVEKSPFRTEEQFMKNVGSLVNFEKLHQAIRNIVG